VGDKLFTSLLLNISHNFFFIFSNHVLGKKNRANRHQNVI
jgi:hypothetical protein